MLKSIDPVSRRGFLKGAATAAGGVAAQVGPVRAAAHRRIGMGPREVVQELDGRDGASPVIVQIDGEVLFRHLQVP